MWRKTWPFVDPGFHGKQQDFHSVTRVQHGTEVRRHERSVLRRKRLHRSAAGARARLHFTMKFRIFPGTYTTLTSVLPSVNFATFGSARPTRRASASLASTASVMRPR